MNYNNPQFYQTGPLSAMRPGSAFTTTPIFQNNQTGLPPIQGQPAIGFTTPTLNNGAVVDLDPITPGIQTSPGIVTPTGPPRIIAGPGINNTTVPFASVESSGFMMGGNLSSFETKSPPLFGIVNGPPSLISNPSLNQINTSITNKINPMRGPLVDQDPITPGFQNQPGLFTQTGPSIIVPSVQSETVIMGNPSFPVVDLDPITPGIQSFPPNISTVGPTTIIGPAGAKKWYRSCPWWIWVIIALGVLGLLIGGLCIFFRPSFGTAEDELARTIFEQKLGSQCRNGQISFNGKCIQCPPSTVWNGRGCSPVNLNNQLNPNLNQGYPSFNNANNIYGMNSSITQPPFSPATVVSQYPLNNDRFNRIQSVNSSWSSGNGNFGDRFSSGSSSRFTNSVAEIKKVIVQPLVEEPLRHY